MVLSGSLVIDLHCTLDDALDDLITHNPLKMDKILYDIDNPVNDEEQDHKDDIINSGYHS